MGIDAKRFRRISSAEIIFVQYLVRLPTLEAAQQPSGENPASLKEFFSVRP